MTPVDEAKVNEIFVAFQTGDWGLGLTLLTALKDDLHNGVWSRFAMAKQLAEEEYCRVRDRVVDEVITEWRSGGFSGSRESAMESLEQSCDNACTYVVDAQYFLAASNNSDAYLEEFGELSCDDGLPWSALATYALRADCIEALKREGIDINERPPSEPQVECSMCCEWKTGTGDTCNECKEAEEDDAKESDEPQPPVE